VVNSFEFGFAGPFPLVVPEGSGIEPARGIWDVVAIAALDTANVERDPLRKVVECLLERHRGVIWIASDHRTNGLPNCFLGVQFVTLARVKPVKLLNLSFGWI
jgi:hypothetical protein